MKRLLSTALLAAGALAAFPSFSANSLVLHSANTGNNYVAYYDMKTPLDAQNFCLSKGGHLAVFNSHAEILDVQKLLALDVSNNYWLGVYALAGQPTYQSVTSQPFFQDPAFTFYIYPTPTSSDTYLKAIVTSSSPALYFSSEPSDIAHFVCEFEDAPL